MNTDLSETSVGRRQGKERTSHDIIASRGFPGPNSVSNPISGTTCGRQGGTLGVTLRAHHHHAFLPYLLGCCINQGRDAHGTPRQAPALRGGGGGRTRC